MKITHGDIMEYKRRCKSQWHDQSWHNFMTLEKSEAIAHGIHEAGNDNHLSNIQMHAMNYLKFKRRVTT